MKRVALILGAAVLFASCAGIPDGEPGFSFDGRLESRIEGAIEAGDNSTAVVLIAAGLPDGAFTEQRIREWMRRISDSLIVDYEGALAAGDFQTALSIANNITELQRDVWSRIGATGGFDAVAGVDDIRLQWAERLLDSHEAVRALLVLSRVEELSLISSELLYSFLQSSVATNNAAAYERLRNELTVRQLEINDQLDLKTASRMLEGTVTVWVNRGIRIANGVGVPDRVIGSGFFIDPRGYLITNYHVISSEVDPAYEGYSRLYIKLPGKPDERIPARVIGYDQILDLALLKVEIDPPYVFSFSNTRELEPGERVFALGSPGGLESTITSGIISASGRRFLQIGDAMQVDVPINPGNSGGPLVHSDGQVAGVVFAGIEQFEGVNFAVPAYWIRSVLLELYEADSVTHSWLGLAVRKADDGLAVVFVVPDGPSEAAGFQVGDVIQELGGVPVRELADAQDIILHRGSGEFITVAVRRDDVVSYRLGGIGERPYSPVEDLLKNQSIDSLFPILFGMTVDEIRSAPWGADYIISDVFPGSIADESSLSVADPFALRNWRVDDELRAAFIEIIIKKRKAGFLESGVQLGAYIEIDSFI